MATNLPDGDFKISENHGVKKKKGICNYKHTALSRGDAAGGGGGGE